MTVVTDMVTYFGDKKSAAGASGPVLAPLSLQEFLDAYPHWAQEYAAREVELVRLARQLEAEGVLCDGGRTFGSAPLNQAFIGLRYDPTDVSYGRYDFLAYGFPFIFAHFRETVRAISTWNDEGDEGIGSGFLIAEDTLITARHCLFDPVELCFKDWDATACPVDSVHVSEDPHIDLAIVRFRGEPFGKVPALRFAAEAILLEPVAALGYPPIQGFQTTLTITTGQVMMEQPALRSGHGHILTSARTRGGFSGGPVISKSGEVVGVILGSPLEPAGSTDERQRPNDLGFSQALALTCIAPLMERNDDRTMDGWTEAAVTTSKEGLQIRLP